jgi:site-specific DNA recombinase
MGICDQPYLPIEIIEQAVADHYATTISFTADFKAEIRAGIDAVMAGDHALTEQTRKSYTAKLEKLDRKESYLLDLAADQEWSTDRLREKVAGIRHERATIARQLDTSQHRHDTSRDVFTAALTLLDNPVELYRTGDETIRAILNKAFFTKIYIDGQKIGGHQLTEPFNALGQAYRDYNSHGATGYTGTGSKTLPKTRGTPKPAPGKATSRTKNETASPNPAEQAKGWSKAVMVDDTGIEPVTSSVSGKRSPAELIVLGRFVSFGSESERTTGFEPATLTLAR